MKNAPSFGFRLKTEIKTMQTPAPGHYNSSIDLVKPRSLAFNYRVGSRMLISGDGRGSDSPPPGRYDF